MMGARRGRGLTSVIGLLCIGIGVVAMLGLMGGIGRWGTDGAQGGRQQRNAQQAVVPQAPQAAQPATNTSPDYLRGYADGQATVAQTTHQDARSGTNQGRGDRQDDRDGVGGDRRGDHDGIAWAGLMALPAILLGALLLVPNLRGRWRRPWAWGETDRQPQRRPEHDQERLPATPQTGDQEPYTSETRRF